MENNVAIIQDLFRKTKVSIDNLNMKFRYPENIGHLLHLIIPAFILKYGLSAEHKILRIFESVPILIRDEHNEREQAFYTSIPRLQDGHIVTDKVIVLQNYQNIPLMSLLDNLVHEYNHAVNSFENEIMDQGDTFTLRTGICHIHYNKKTMQVIRKDDDYILEEIINTKQTEEIIDIIHSFRTIPLSNTIAATLYAIDSSISGSYTSNAYGLQSYLCKELMKNRTFLATFSSLRFSGNIDDMDSWFDQIIGKKGSYKRFIAILIRTTKLEQEYEKTVFFKKMKLNQIRSLYQEAMQMIEVFNANCNYK